jgi:hypothetical protein
MYPAAPAGASLIFNGEDQLAPPFDELRYQTFQASGSWPVVCMYQMRTFPPPDDASRGWVAFSPFTERGTPGLHVRPAFVDVET